MFKIIPEFSAYKINLEGIIIQINTNKEISKFTIPSKTSELQATLWHDSGVRRTKSVKRLIKTTFNEIFEPVLPPGIIRHENSFEGLLEDSNELVKELRLDFKYNLDTGVFIRVRKQHNGRYLPTYTEGGIAEGYRVIRYAGTMQKVHRLLFMYMIGAIPSEAVVDHVNRDKLDNRWCNLRLVTKDFNVKNSSLYSNNSSGAMGVSWHKKQQKWNARIMIKGVSVHLGSFDSKDEAILAREAALQKHSFSQGHGELAPNLYQNIPLEDLL